jgi:hypothetical protein
MDKVFKALADASRRELLDRLHASNGQTLGQLCETLDISRQAVLPEQLDWRISPSGPGTVKLLLVHSRLSEEFYRGVSEGWPTILSSLKSLLEVGRPLDFYPRQPPGEAQSQAI